MGALSILVLVNGFAYIMFLAYKRSVWQFIPVLILAISVFILFGEYTQDNGFFSILSIGATIAIFIGLILISSPPKMVEKEVKVNLKDTYNVELRTSTNKKVQIENINRGVSIFGSSGSGKTESVIYAIMRHYAKYNFPGLMNDYKDFELTEIAYPLFRESNVAFKVFSLADPNRSVCINPIDPQYIKTESDVNGLVKVLMLNLNPTDGNDDTSKFFRGASESLLAGVIWRLKVSYPDKCNLPFIIALLLNSKNLHLPKRPYGKIVDFLLQDTRAEILASTFLTGLGSEKQTAALFSTLAENLRVLATPEVFYLLSRSDISLDLNNPANPTILSLVNNPKNDSVISPVLAMIVEACFAQMSVRERGKSFVLLDEAPTIKIMGLGKRIATLRTYGVSFVYCMQDKIQGLAQWGGKEYFIKEILTNLSTQFMGKVNDPDTAAFYEKYFEIVQKTQVSVSKKDSIISSSDSRITRSKKDQSKIRGFEFFRLKQGEFVMFNDGKDYKFRFKWIPPMKNKPPLERMITPSELEQYYLNVIHEVENLFD